MLNQGNKIKLVLFFIILHFTKCINTNNQGIEYTIYKKSREVVSEDVYRKIYSGMKDSLKTWCLNKLPNVLGESMWGYYVDSLMCFNNAKNKLITSIIVACKDDKCVQDEIKFLYGTKINNLWYFFRGPSIAIPREMVKDHDIHKPLSYEELHQIALKEVYSGYLNEKGQINDSFFSDLVSVAWCTDCKTQEDWDNAYLKWIKNNWASRDTTKPILQLP